jgi:hypothetical protein
MALAAIDLSRKGKFREVKCVDSCGAAAQNIAGHWQFRRQKQSRGELNLLRQIEWVLRLI